MIRRSFVTLALPKEAARMDGMQRRKLIEQFEAGPEALQGALSAVPKEALQWRPGPQLWSAHEVVCHCADSEMNAAARLRYLVAEAEPVIIGYDQDEWARALDYHAQDLRDALATVFAVRRSTAGILRRMPESAWKCHGTHTEHGPYSVLDWMRIYAGHLDAHARQIARNVERWNARHA
jgi:hypothetical protein